MIDDQDERLLQDELDGVASPEGSKRLRDRLAQSAELRARRLELQTVSHALDQVRMEKPPADLREGVMAAIAAAEHPGPARRGWLENPGGASRGRPVLAWAYPFLAGAVAGGLLIALATGSLAPRAWTDLPVIGAMLPGAGRGALVDHRDLRLGTARVALETRRAADGVRVEFEVARAQGAELTLESDIAALQPVEQVGTEAFEGAPLQGRLDVEDVPARLGPGEAGREPDLGLLALLVQPEPRLAQKRGEILGRDRDGPLHVLADDLPDHLPADRGDLALQAAHPGLPRVLLDEAVDGAVLEDRLLGVKPVLLHLLGDEELAGDRDLLVLPGQEPRRPGRRGVPGDR